MMLEIGPAKNVMLVDASTKNAVDKNMPAGTRPTSSRSPEATVSKRAARFAGRANTTSPSGASARSRRKPLDHTFIMAYRVNSEVITAPPMSTHASQEPSSAPAWMSMTLPRKPENGGMPPRFSAGMRYSSAITGAV